VIPSSCLDSLTPPPLLNHTLYPPPPSQMLKADEVVPVLVEHLKKTKKGSLFLKKKDLSNKKVE